MNKDEAIQILREEKTGTQTHDADDVNKAYETAFEALTTDLDAVYQAGFDKAMDKFRKRNRVKYLVYMSRGMFQDQQIDIVEADNFKMKDNLIIFKKGFRSVSFFHAALVEKILREGEAE